MKSRRKATKPKRGPDADAPASDGGDSARARKRPDPLGLVDADSIHDLMTMNGPKVTRWAFQCVEKVARGRASLLEQKIALMMIQKCTPSTGRKGEEEPDDLPEGTTKAELLALDKLIKQEQEKHGGLAPAHAEEGTRIARDTAAYQVREPKQPE